jgi:hypothetical protein
MLYEMVYSQPPYVDGVLTLRRGADEAMDRVIRRCLEKAPARRSRWVEVVELLEPGSPELTDFSKAVVAGIIVLLVIWSWC